MLTTGIVDIHHADGAYDLDDVVRGGAVALWHKNSEGVTFLDRAFVQAMDRAKDAGLLRGAYHFARGTSNAVRQAELFVDDVRSLIDNCGDDILIALDLEGSLANPRTMSTDDAARFLSRVHTLTGRWPVLYQGLSKGRARMRKASEEVRAIFGSCPLWLAAYGPDPRTQPAFAPWERWSLMQYTNGSDGPRDKGAFPRLTPGFLGRQRQDRSVFRGTPAELAAWWASCGRSPEGADRTV